MFTRAVHPGAQARLLAFLGHGLRDRGAAVGWMASFDDPVARDVGGVRDVDDGVVERAAEGVANHTADSIAPTSPLERFGAPLLSHSGPLAALRVARDAVRRFRPDVVITDDERDTMMAALASGAWRGANGARAGVVRRVRADADSRTGWRTRFAARRTRVALLLPAGYADAHGGAASLRSVRAALALPPVPRAASDFARIAPERIVCVPDRSGTNAASCLRAVARLRVRRPRMRLQLVGDASELQAVRVHAAALGLTDCIDIVPESVLFGTGLPDAVAVWVATDGDDGALAAIAAMRHGLPVVVDRGSSVAALVAHHITGFHADESDLSTCIASLAQLLADAAAYRAIGDAALARAQRVHAWPALLDRVSEAIAFVEPGRRT